MEFGKISPRTFLEAEEGIVPAASEGRMIRYFLIALIVVFFLMPVLTPYFFDCNLSFNSKRIASALLLFFNH
jgi:hypothetical protein